MVEQFKGLPNLGAPSFESPFTLHKSTEKFADAKIQVTIFSDFECPFCKKVSDQFHEVIRGYEDHINVQYFFYPLDQSCNSNIKRAFHQYACAAAYTAACDATKFKEVHDAIFESQSSLSLDLLNKIEKNFQLKDCSTKDASKKMVRDMIDEAAKFNLTSTPTIIINGVKIEGSIPTSQIHAIFNHILEK